MTTSATSLHSFVVSLQRLLNLCAMNQGFVYILTNPVFQEDWVKIGQTEDIDKRIKSLSCQTCLPHPFELYAYCKTSKYKLLERQIHRLLEYAHKRITPSREFFHIVPSEALKELRLLASTIDDAEFFISKECEEVNHRTSPAPRFRFSMAHLMPGDELIFEPTGARVVVAKHKDDNRIEFDGMRYTLSGYCRKFMPENKRNAKEAYQGPMYFSHNGRLLVKMREEHESAKRIA